MGMEIEPEDITKLIDGIYKNLIEKFNPNAIQLIAAGKAYLKALQGLTAASNSFGDSLSKIAINAQQSLSSDIGDALSSFVNIQRTIQEHQVNVLKAFYADLLMPLETNLDKDTKVIQTEQKRFLQQHKSILENYCKAVTALKKQRKKKRTSGLYDKELKILQHVEEEKLKLKQFCNSSFKSVVLQERRRYGFILERQCSIGKHLAVYHETGKNLYEDNIEELLCVAGTRESFGFNIDNHLKKKIEELKDLDNMNLRKTRSMDIASDYWKSNNDKNELNQNSLPRTKSEHNLTITNSSSDDETVPNELEIVTALFAYEESGKNQLSLEKGDKISLIGNSANGWKFGKNIRTKIHGWFPETYIENRNSNLPSNEKIFTPITKNNQEFEEASNSRIFGDTLVLQNTKYFQNISSSGLRTSPPAILPPPVPNSSQYQLNANQMYSNSLVDQYYIEKNTSTFNTFQGNKMLQNQESGIVKSNESPVCPPPQPEIDYSDEEKSIKTPIRKKNVELEISKKPTSLESINANFKVDKSKKDNFIKRTKSFWRSKKTEDPVNETNLWKHKDIINNTLPSNNISNNNNNIATNKIETVDRRRQKSYKKSTNEFDHKSPNLNKINNKNDKKRNINNIGSKYNNNGKQKYPNSNDNDDSDVTEKILETQSFDDSGGENNRKTVKRREILKQYYSSDSDSEKLSRTSDQYDCIVIDDHLVRNKFEFKSFSSSNNNNNNKNKTFNVKHNNNNAIASRDMNLIDSDTVINATLLPRTKLNKNTKSNVTPKVDDFNNDNVQYINGSIPKAYGPWYNLWEQQNANLKDLNNP